MIQDFLTLSAFGLAAAAFGGWLYSSRHLNALIAEYQGLVQNLDPLPKELSRLKAEITSLESHISISEDLRQGLQVKLETSGQKLSELSQVLEDQKRSSAFKEQAWLQDQKNGEQLLSEKEAALIQASEKIALLELKINAQEQILLSKDSQVTVGPSDGPDSFNSGQISNPRLKETAASLHGSLLKTTRKYGPKEGSKRSLTLSSKRNDFLDEAALGQWGQVENDSRESEPTDSREASAVADLPSKILPQPMMEPIESENRWRKKDALKIDQLNLMVKTLQGRKSMLEERNQNWEVALRYLSEHVLRVKGEKPVSAEIGPLVAQALESINKSLMMNEMFSTNLDDLDDLSTLHDLIHDSHGSLKPFKREYASP